jgi:hypothetical protein
MWKNTIRQKYRIPDRRGGVRLVFTIGRLGETLAAAALSITAVKQ